MITFAPHETDERIAICTLDRPEKRNALSVEMLETLCECHDYLGHKCKNAHVLLLRGEGRAFCAGFDLSAARENPDVLVPLLASLSRACRAIRRLEIPVVCGVQGAAIAGGCALLAACDYVVASREAKLGYPVVQIGVSPAVTTPLLAKAIGLGHTRERVLDPGLVDGQAGAQMGLVHELVDTDDDVQAAALEAASLFADKPAHSVRGTKKWLNTLDNSYSDDAFDDSLMCSVDSARTDSAREALARIWKD
ncbi:MAG: enoyl-CoA hydratase/isomerase family protein [Planctomycetota bacterium]|jgi:methylglutaconyl-CoA hydratase